MYYEYFGLDRAPFKITPDTQLFYNGAMRGAILDALKYAIRSGEGIIKVVGEVGSGKTMLCRMLEVRIPENIDIVYLANPSLSPDDILHAIAFEMGLPVSEQDNRLKVMQILQQTLLDKHREGRQIVLFVEEAQGMPLDTLEEIRLLSNLETSQEKLLQIVLFGQPELDRNLATPSIRQLRERITHSFNLGPFQNEEVRDYLMFRLRSAGYTGPDVFTHGAVKLIAKASKGLVRRINILADKSLLAAYSQELHQIRRCHVLAAIRESEFEMPTRMLPAWLWGGGLVAVGLASGLAVAGLYINMKTVDTAPSQNTTESVIPHKEYPAVPVPAGNTSTPVNKPRVTRLPDDARGALNSDYQSSARLSANIALNTPSRSIDLKNSVAPERHQASIDLSRYFVRMRMAGTVN